MNDRIYLSLAAALLSSGVLVNGCVSGQGNDDPCSAGLSGRFEIQTSEDLARLEGCASLDGSLHIRGTDLQDLSGLESLERIEGSLSIGYEADSCMGNPSLVDVSALGNLETVEGELAIVCNGALEGLDGLQTLSTVGEDLWIGLNDSLLDLDGLSGLESVAGWLDVENNNSLPTCEAIELLEQLDPPPSDVCIISNLEDECEDDCG